MGRMNTQVNFRTNRKTLSRADKVFQDMGMDRSTALNMFLSRVEAEKGLPFTPTANTVLLRARWDMEVARAKKTRGYKTAKAATRAALK
jgi:addiction module RelB/DinJ family antitoxin